MSKNDNVSVQEKIQKLNELTLWFESDEFVLEEAVSKYTEAKKLADEISQDLEKFKNTITVLEKDFSA